jgi:penicillin-binding protein 1C
LALTRFTRPRKIIASSVACSAFLLYLLLTAGIAANLGPFPNFEDLRSYWRPSYAYLLDRHGEVLHELRVDYSVQRLPWTPLAEISPALKRAVLYAEDRRFYQHRGVDWRALGAALFERLQGQGRRGASTLSMQLAARLDPRLTPPHGQRSLLQKLQQIRAALVLEQSWDKDQILEAYLNFVSFYGELEGIRAAARGLFTKDPSGIGEAEAVVLAALLPAPGATAARLKRRACTLAQSGRFEVACGQLEQLVDRLTAKPPAISPRLALAPHLAQDLLRHPGERVKTTLDTRIQRLALTALRHQLLGLDGRNVRDAAALVVDNRTGAVLAYIGSAGPDSRARFVDGVRARRQAGSTLKPFLYGLAVERGYLTAASLLQDAPVNLETAAGLYVPQNYDHDFKGRVSVRTALASSLNIPAVRTLMLLGIDAFHTRLRSLGYTGLVDDPEYYGYSLALGSAEVSLLDQVKAYQALANGGLMGPLHLRHDKVFQPLQRIMSEQAAFIISEILSDRAGRSLTFGLANPMSTRFVSAVKTGTSKDMRDNWCIGYTGNYTVGVWVGNFEGDAMRDVSGVTGAAPAWLEIIEGLEGSRPSKPRSPPAGVVSSKIRFEPPVEPERQEWFMAGTEQAISRLADPRERPPRIHSPADGLIIALDPDIPAHHQALLFAAQGDREVPNWMLDGRVLGQADTLLWLPTPGNHLLLLTGPDNKAYDQVSFQVRGRVR